MFACCRKDHAYILWKGASEVPEGMPTDRRSALENHVRQGVLSAAGPWSSVESCMQGPCPVGRTCVHGGIQDLHGVQVVAPGDHLVCLGLPNGVQALLEMELLQMDTGSTGAVPYVDGSREPSENSSHTYGFRPRRCA